MKLKNHLLLLILILSCSPVPRESSFKSTDFFDLITTDKLRQHVTVIASDSLRGRGFGTEGLKKAAKYVANEYHRIGLKFGGDEMGANRYFQAVTESVSGELIQSQNVVAFLEGSDQNLREEAIVVMAHLDHLGVDPTLPGDSIYNGASDNASGVAASLLLAEAITQAKKAGAVFKRRIVFLNTTGEEKHGRAGSRHYVQDAPVVPLSKTVAAINMDGVAGIDTANLPGNENYIYVIGNDSTSIDLKKRNSRINEETGINLELTEPPFAFGSDQKVFEGWLIPSIYFSTGLTSKYHRVDDHATTINYIHSQKVVQLIFALIWELTNEPDVTPSFDRSAFEPVAGEFRCRPCGCKADHLVFDEGGTCPDCHMALIPVWKRIADAD